MPETLAFDAFYKDARDRLLLQTFALTGDLPAARAAVRDAFILSWHHWRKVSRLADPETDVRPRAWTLAQRRANARVWHKEKGLAPENAATLDALAKLTAPQRRMLLLTVLAPGTLAEHAREVGLSEEAGATALQQANAQFSVRRDIPTVSIPATLEALGSELTQDRWARGSIIRRAGTARRRAHTVLGAAAAVTALVASGIVVGQGDVRPALAAADQTTTQVSADKAPEVPDALVAADLVRTKDARRLDKSRTWKARATSGNTDGDGLVLPCQQQRYADPDPASALLRTITAKSVKRKPDIRVRQLAELSASDTTAQQALKQARRWVSQCRDPRMQLLGTYDLAGVGDDAAAFVLRSWRPALTTEVVAMARTGRITSIVTTRRAGVGRDLDATVRLLSGSITRACKAKGGGACGTGAHLVGRRPYPVGSTPALLSEIDLPAVSKVQRPWVGTEPRQAKANFAASGCARAPFNLETMSRQVTRSFLVPRAKLPATFGITQTAGALATAEARQWVRDVRKRLATCVDKRLGTTATPLRAEESAARDLLVWRITTEVTEERSVSYLMALVRQGTAVTQIGFIPAPGVGMSDLDFVNVARRGQERLSALPSPKKVKQQSGHQPGKKG
jgi:hypothetical protein